jgi:hypothetical protein
MDRSYPFSRHIEQRRHVRRRALAAVSAGIAAYAVAFAMLPAQAPYAPLTLDATTLATPPETMPVSDPIPAARRVYRYSVVPGGAADRAELERVLRSDKVVAAHYAGFDVARAHAVTVSASRAVHVSYRKGDKIYWTARKVMLQAGETLLTDGRNEMRTRCANRISDLPRLPVERHAPSPDALDELVDEAPDGTAGEITHVNAPELALDGDLPELTGRPFQPVWPADAPPAGNPRPARPPYTGEPAPGLPWPQTGWLGNAGLPPQSGATPGTQVLASITPPPVSHAIAVVPDPLPDAGPGDPAGDPAAGEPAAGEPANWMPPPAVTDIDPFIPQRDPSQPAAPSNPPLAVAQPADLPEPASAWLVAGALVALLVQRRQRSFG